MARWRNARTGALLLGLTVGIAAAFGPAQAAKVGVAAAVDPDAFSSLSGGANKQLNIGKSIFYNERIETTANGLVQVLLVDGSTFTVGPNSDLVIDKFVYNPKKKTGEIVATFSKGTMRFIGGKLSKNAGGVTVKTPNGALAIRGGMFQGNASRGVYSFLYGHSLTFRSWNGQTRTIYEPGYTLDLTGGGANVRPTTAADTNAFMQALANGGTNHGSGDNGDSDNPGGPGAFQTANDLQNGASELISDANATLVQTQILQQLANLEALKNQDNKPSSGEPPVKNGGTFSGYSIGLLETGAGNLPELVHGTSHVVLDPEENTVTAAIQVEIDDGPDPVIIGNAFVDEKTTQGPASVFNLGYRGLGNGAYIDDYRFLALGDDGSSSVMDYPYPFSINGSALGNENRLSIQSAGGNPVSNVGNFASIPTKLCSACDFLRFGFWSSNVTYNNGEYTDQLGGWWIASNAPVSANDMPTAGSANYKGLAIGTFVSNQNGTWSQRPETGDMTMNWSFTQREGRLDVKNFGGKKFGGTMTAPGQVNFGGNIAGSGAAGLAAGSFVGPRGGQAPAGVMGKFEIRNNEWGAAGIFGGGRVPNGNR